MQVALAARLRPFLRSGLAVAIEAGNQTAWIYEVLVALGAQVTVVNPNKVKLIAESRCKTDKVDAKILSELLRLGGLPEPVHMPGKETRALRGLLVARRQLVAARTKVGNVVRGLLRQEGLRLPSHALMSFIGWQRLLEQGFEHEHLAVIVAAYSESFRRLTQSIQELERELAEREKGDARAARLQTMPRVGRISSLTFLAAVDDVKRFASSRKLVGYRDWRQRCDPAVSGPNMAPSVAKVARNCERSWCRSPTWGPSTRSQRRHGCGAGSSALPYVGARKRQRCR